MTENTKQEAALRNKTLSVLANINAVEGFDPHMVTACYQDTEGNGRMYLQAEFSMLWFRLKYPNGRLEQVLSRMNDQMATVEGRVYDNDGNLLANAFVTRYRGEEQFGKDYVQNAGTAAIRKALGNCGFGTPADAVYIEGVTPLFKAVEDEDVPVFRLVSLSRPSRKSISRTQNLHLQHLSAAESPLQSLHLHRLPFLPLHLYPNPYL